jgi:hypothetical protein
MMLEFQDVCYGSASAGAPAYISNASQLACGGSIRQVNATIFSVVAFLVAAIAQQPPRRADVNAQREAMKKLGFLVGKWSGEGRMLRATGEWIDITQTENVEYSSMGCC